MPTRPSSRPALASARSHFLARTALCGALYGLSVFAPHAAHALPVGGIPQTNPGGGQPAITTTTSTMDVTLNAPRTVLSWTSFNVTPDETVTFNFQARNGVVLNQIIGLTPSKIEGVVQGKVGGGYGGNIWFSSQSSIIFGKGARIDAGSLLVGIGTPDLQTFLDPSSNLFKFSGSDNLPDSRILVLSNAALTAHGGMVALMGPSVVTRANAVIKATDGSVLYGSAKSYQIRLAPGAAGDFDLVDFIVPTASDGSEAAVAADLAGATTANSVFVAAVSHSAIGSAVINLEGLVTAQAAKTDGGDIVLSGGGGIANRLPGPALAEAAPTDIYLNRATASRDLLVSNVGRTIARPWVRPPDATMDPPTLAEDKAAAENAGNGNGFPNGAAPLETVTIDEQVLISLFDPTAVSTVSAGRDARFAATATIELGRVVASRDISVSGPEIKANSLIASGAVTATSTVGDIRLAGLGAGRESKVTAKADAYVDAVNAPQKLTVTSGRDVTIGDGVSAVTGAITVSAPQNVTVNMGSGRLDSVTAGASANLRGAAVDIGTLSAPRVFGQAESLRIGTATTTGDLYVVATSGDAIVDTATAGDDIFVIATNGAASLRQATLTGVGFDGIGVDFAGNPDTVGNGRVVRVESTNFDARLGLGSGGVTGATSVTVKAGQDAVVDVLRPTPGAFSVTAARDATLKAPTVTLQAVTAGRDLSFGSTTGDFTLTTTLVATRNISVSAAGALKVGDVKAASGSVSLTGTTVTAGAVSASEDLILKATSGGVTTASYTAGRDLIVQGASLSLGAVIGPVARDLSITSLGNFTSSAPLTAGRNLTLDVNGKATIGATTAGGAIRILANDLDLTGALTAPNAQIESRTGALQVGGSGAASGLSFDSADFGQLRVSGTVKFYAGSTTGAARGDLTVLDLALNPSNTPNVTFLVGSGNTARVQGAVAPTSSGGVLRIGDAVDLNWRPGSILVSGSLGAATYAGGDYTGVRAFSEVRLAARQDILVGSQRFITLVQDTPVDQIDLAGLKPAGVAAQSGELFRVNIATGRLEVSADNKVVQQNTAPAGSQQPIGLLFTGQFSPSLIIDPPKVVELFGAIVGQGGGTVGGQKAGGAITFTVVDASGQPTAKPADAVYRFNACDVGTGNCSPLLGGGTTTGAGGGGSGGIVSETNTGLLVTRDTLATGGVPGSSPLASGPGSASTSSATTESTTSDEAGAAAVSAENLVNPPVLLGVAPVEADEIVTDPVVTGTGSEEIWRKRRQKQ